MLSWHLFGIAQGIITSADTQEIAFESSLYNQWHSTIATINDQRIPGCFLDFGTDKTWVASRDLCNARPCAFGSTGYSAGNSQSQPDRDELGDVAGTRSTGTFLFGSLRVESEFLLANSSAINWSCRLGLGPGPNGILRKLQKDRILDSNTLSFYSLEQEGGRLIFGGSDTLRNASQLEWIPVTKDNSWTVSLTKFNIGQEDIPGLEVGFFASFNDFTFLPNDIARRINERLGLRQIPGSFHNANGWAIECSVFPSNFPSMNLLFGNTLVTISPREYLFRTNVFTEPLCFSSIFGIPSGSKLVPSLGSIMLQSYLLAFDFENLQIGIARANRAAGLEAQLTPASAPFKVTFANQFQWTWWVIGLIVLGGILLLALLGCVVFCCCKRRKRDPVFMRQTPREIKLPNSYNGSNASEGPRKRIVQVNPNVQYQNDVESAYPDNREDTILVSTIETERISPNMPYQYNPHFPIQANSRYIRASPESMILSDSLEPISPISPTDQFSVGADADDHPSQNLNRVQEMGHFDPSQNLNSQVS
jgi:hypothetical protein